MEARTYKRISDPKTDLDPTHIEKNSFPDEVHLQAVKVIIALYLLVKSTQADLLENLHLVKMGQLIKINKGEDYTKITQALQSYCRQYVITSISQEKSQEYRGLFTRLKYSVRNPKLFKQQDRTKEETIFELISTSLSAVFSILEKVFSTEDVAETLLKSPKLGGRDDKIIDNPTTATAKEERELIEHYYVPQILREQNEHNVLGYQNQDEIFYNLDQAIFKMMKLNQRTVAQNLLKHRMLLVTYLLNNKDSMEKILLVQKLSRATGKVVNTYASDLSDAKKINAAVDDYYADCVTSNVALSADSTGKRIIKSVAAIAAGLLFCALVLCVAWLISYFWVGIVLADISWKIQTGIAVTATCSLAISGFFSFKKLRGEGYLDSEISQSTKTIAENMRQISSSPAK